jgi:bacteriorhodopsin
MNETNWLWLGAIGMLAGSVVLFAAGGRRTQDEEGHSLLHGFVPLFAAISYFAMAVHQGEATLSSGRVFLFARYLDWSVTTPSLLLGISMTALHGVRRRPGLVAGLLTSDVVMIVTGLFFGASQVPFIKWVWYAASCVAFLAVLWVLFGPLMEEARARDQVRRDVYVRNAIILTVLWLIYPVLVLAGPDGIGVLSPTSATAGITVLDLVAKVVYGLIAMVGSKAMTSADLIRGEVSAAEITTHAIPSGALRPARRA